MSFELVLVSGFMWLFDWGSDSFPFRDKMLWTFYEPGFQADMGENLVSPRLESEFKGPNTGRSPDLRLVLLKLHR